MYECKFRFSCKLLRFCAFYWMSNHNQIPYTNQFNDWYDFWSLSICPLFAYLFWSLRTKNNIWDQRARNCERVIVICICEFNRYQVGFVILIKINGRFSGLRVPHFVISCVFLFLFVSPPVCNNCVSVWDQVVSKQIMSCCPFFFSC